MRWSCPHCGINLAAADEKLGPGWSFSQCYKCAGFALIRRAEVNLIKVDRAPVGENVILPEPSEEPLLNSEASQRLSHYFSKKSEDKPTIRPATKRAQAPVQATAPIGQAPNTSPTTQEIINNLKNEGSSLISGESSLPDPLPEIGLRGFNLKGKTLPLAIGIAGAMAVGSGVYLYIQGQILWEKAASGINAPESRDLASNPSGSEVVQAPPLVAKNQPTAHRNGEMTDRLRQSAMAPDRTSEETGIQQLKEPAIENDIREDTPLQALLPKITPPVESKPAPAAHGASLVVQAKINRAHMRAGPGSHYPMVATADTRLRYPVIEWSDRWFRVALPGPSGKMAWIRNDLVQVVSSQASAGKKNQQ